MKRRTSPSSSPNLPTIVLVLAVTVGAIAACYGQEHPAGDGGAPGQGVYIESTWQTTRGVSGHKKHVIDEKIACTKCHDLTQTSIGRVTPGRCAACHDKESRIEHAGEQARARFGPSAKADCTTCHAFTLEGTGHDAGASGPAHAPAASDCSRCHAARQGSIPAVTVHGTSECVKCHRPHEDDRLTPAPCVDCHDNVTTTHAAQEKSGTEMCTTCHAHQHAPASEALGACSKCHATHEPKIPASALFSEGHNECVGCHRPHEFEKNKAIECRSCHEDVRVLAAPRVPQHARCTSCHSPHDVRGTPDKACAGCHKSVHPNHPKHGVAGTCVGCHDPHPSGASIHATARACSACHQAAASDSEFHAGVGCKQCHEPHTFLLESSNRAVCKTCHAGELQRVAGLPGHAACEGCHGGLPHRPERLLAGCESCHANEHSIANAGHQKCTNCHEPHGGTLAKDCKSCHAGEHQTAPAGHRDCTSCHDGHSGSTARAACSTCHAAEARSAHGRLGQSCNQCHRPHGPEGVATPPSCGSCHASTKLSGLHHVSQHRDCARCHSGHGEPPDAKRTGCLNCHTDRKNHFPNAPNCTSCHLFGPTR
jgi:hypothetical protein